MKLLLIILTILQPISWSSQQVNDSVVLTASIQQGWHMTLISIGDSTIGEDYEGTYQYTMPQDSILPIRFTACDDQQCLAPQTFEYTQPSQSPARDRIGSRTGVEPMMSLFLLGLLAGLLAIFTPCVWPIIPMTVSFFLKKGGGLRDALLYGLSIVVIYVGLGLLVTVIFGASALNALSTNAIVNLFFFALLVVFALSFFGLFEITLPASWSTSLDNKARLSKGWWSILLMATTLVVVSFSCTGPIIGTLLVEAASYSLLAPTIGMLGFAVALALPFTLFALFPQWMQQLPKSGEWMQGFKVTLACLELALSLKFLSVADMAYGWGILPRWLFIALWIICFAGLGIYLIRRSWVGKIVAIVSWLFTIYLIPGLWGAPVKMIAAFAPPAPTSDQTVFYNYEEGLQYAQQTHRPVLVNFTGYGCVNCRKMEEFVLSDDSVKARMQNYVYIVLYVDSRMDADANEIEDGIENSRLQQERFGSNAQPFFIQLDPNGTPISDPCAFIIDPDKFLRWLVY